MRFLTLILLIMLPLVACADEAPAFNLVSFTEQASAEVDNDTLVAVLYAQREGPRADVIADQVNRLIAKAVDQAKETPGIKVQTGNYRTSAVYQDSDIRGWRVYQSLHLESRDSKRLGDLIGHLQKTLKVQSISYQLSRQQRRTYQKQLITRALHNFQQRATDIAHTLGKSGYRIVHLSVDTGGPGPIMLRSEMLGVTKSLAVGSAPRIEAGTQRIQVTVSAQIELKN